MSNSCRAAYSRATAQERAAANEADYARQEFQRQSELVGKGIAAKSALDEARRDLTKTEEDQAAAQQGIASALAALGGDASIETEKHPAVLQAGTGAGFRRHLSPAPAAR